MAHDETGSLGSVSPVIQALASGKRAEPGPAERAAAYSFGVTQRSEQPGWWGRDVWEQIDHYKGAVALAIQPYINFFLGANYCAYRKRKGAGTVRKSVPGGESKYSRDDGYEPLEDDHPVCEVLRRPGGDDGAFTLGFEMAFGTLQRLLTGQAPFWLPVNKDGKPCQLYALTAAYTQAAYSPGHPQYPQGAYRVLPAAGWGWATTALNVPALLPAEEVALLKDINPVSRHRGKSKLELGAKQIDLLNAIVDFQWSYFNEGCALDMVVSVPGADEATAKAIKRDLLEKHGGSRNARKLAVFGGGYGGEPGKSISAVNLAPNAKDLDFPNGRTMSLQEVMAFFGTPKVLAGYTEDSNYATYIGQLRMFRDMWLKPAFEIASDFLSKHLAEPWAEDDEELVIAIEPQIPKDEDAAAKELEFAVGQGLITVNEYRHATGRDSVPDGDLPASAYTQKVQQDIAPPPMPGMDPNAPPVPGNEGLPGAQAGSPGNAPPGVDSEQDGTVDAGAQGDDSPEAVQDATTQAALAALGLGGDQAAPMPDDGAMMKAAVPVNDPKRKVRAEGETWTGADGKQWTKRGGKIVPAPQQTGSGAAQSAQQQRPQPGSSAAPAPQQPQTDPRQYHAEIIKRAGKNAKAFGLTPEVLAKMHPDAVKTIAAQLGVAPPEEAYGKHAASVPVTPAAKSHLQRAGEWADAMAAKHAQRVAQHLGISPQAAQKILAKAIRQVAEHALKSGGRASGTLSVGGRSLRLGVGAKPAGAVGGAKDGAGERPQPGIGKSMSAISDPDGGFLVPPAAVPVRKKKRKKRPVCEIVQKALLEV